MSARGVTPPECLVCSSPVDAFFTKDFHGACGLNMVEYTRCGSCGFVSSRTHQEMADDQWKTLNDCYHSTYLGGDSNDDDPRWLGRIYVQANTIQSLTQLGLLPRQDPWIDWGCGDGKLADILSEALLPTGKYDEFMGAESAGWLRQQDLAAESFDLVVSTSVLEHFRRPSDFSKVMGLVSNSGVVALHTLVRDAVPGDPSWFYLLPVHCAFYTNASMQILFDKWGFTASLYAVDARMWFWFRTRGDEVEGALPRLGLLTDQEFHFKRGFVDYWRD